jgi:EmrB/QacA subfamily drug resistance transporter
MSHRPDDLRPRSPRLLLNEVPRPVSIRSWRFAPWLAVAAVCLGALMSQIDSSIVTLAYPTLQRHYDVSLGAVTWVGLAYLLTVVATLVAFGRLSDMFGRKLIYVYGFVLFLVGSVACGMAPSLGLLVVSRVLQAMGGSMIQANSVAIVVLSLPVAKRTKGLGYQAAAQALGLALGPTLGGLLLGVASWRWLFWVNIPVGLVALPAAALFIPRSRNLQEPTRLDWPGTGLLMAAVVSFFGSLSMAGSLGWTSPAVLAGLALALVLGLAFVRRERRCEEPLLSPSLLRTPAIARGLLAAAASYFALFGLMLTVPFLVERGLGGAPAEAGLVLLALPLMIGLTAPLSGRLVRVLGTRRVTLGAALLAASGILVAAASTGSLGRLIGGLGIAGVGLGAFNTVNNAGVMGAIAPEQTAVGSAMLNTTRGLGTALGLAAGGAIFAALGGASRLGHGVADAFSITAVILAAAVAVAGLLAASARGEVR